MHRRLADLVVFVVLGVAVALGASVAMDLLGVDLGERQSLVATVLGVLVVSIVAAEREERRDPESHDARRRTRLP